LGADRLSKSETRAVQPLLSKSTERVADCGCAVYCTWEQITDRLGGDLRFGCWKLGGAWIGRERRANPPSQKPNPKRQATQEGPCTSRLCGLLQQVQTPAFPLLARVTFIRMVGCSRTFPG